MAEVTSNGASAASKKQNTSTTATAAAGEAGSGSTPSAGTSSSINAAKDTASKTADKVAENNAADSTSTGGARNGENGDNAASGEAVNGATDGAKKHQKKKSLSGVPEHKNKKLSKKKSMPNIHLSVKPGEYWYVRMKGHPPWPSIICDEDMLPESLLSKRPVSAANVDGSYRPDFQDGGKNAKDRRYPVMFLYTNEFAWQVNSELHPLDKDELKDIVARDDKGKRTKALWEAYLVAAEDHDLEYFKTMLRQHEKNVQEEQDAIREAEAKKAEEKAKKIEKAAERAAKKEKRKSEAKAKDQEGDAEKKKADSAETPAKKKGNKRKKTEESEGEGAKPAKTPKTLKVNGPKEDSAAKPKKAAPKPKKPKAKEPEQPEPPQQPEEKPLTEEDKREKLFKTVLYLRHKLQKGFLTRDQEPKAEEMDLMNEQFKQLEAIDTIDGDVIKKTKINKVLKAIIRLTSIPKEEIHEFKRRSTDLLQDYNKVLAADGGSEGGTAEPTTNGVGKAEGSNSPKDEAGDLTMVDAHESTETKPNSDATEAAKASAA